MTAPIKVGDFVTISTGRFPLTWEVYSISEHQTELPLDLPHMDTRVAILKSGQTGRRRFEPVRNLTLFPTKEPA